MQQEHLGPLYLSLLGPFTLTAGGRPQPLPRRNERALLAFLALSRSPMAPREALRALLWPDQTSDNGRRRLRQALYRLRRSLPQAPRRENDGVVDLLLAARQEIGINPDADFDSDVAAFRRLLDNVRTHRHASLEQCGRCAGDLKTAVSLYRDDFLLDLTLGPDSPFDAWAAQERSALRGDLLYALSQLANIYMAAGQYGRAEPVVRRRIAVDPAAEPAYRQLMTLLARSGRQEDALAVFETVRGRLARSGAAPSAATRALQAEILADTIDERTTRSELAAFEMREEIAHGAYGVIYRAYQPSVEREVAIKAIRPEIASNRDFTRRLETEARIVARLEHPHIVPIYTFWHDKNGAFLVMRLLHGGSLREMLRRGALDHAFVLKILDQIADALDAVHQHGVVHRDLKPGNILLDESGNAYLTDFGIAKDLVLDDHQSGAEGLVGSPAYISPEQLRSEPVTPRSDIYSLGIILYQMLAGELPFKELSLAALLQHQLNEPIPLLSEGRAGVPAAVDRVLARATAKRPEDRYPDVLSLAADFRQALAGEGDAVAAGEIASARRPLSEPPGIQAALVQAPLFVARETQLADLDRRFQAARNGQGQVVCITGGAGRGKSALLSEFARRAMAEHPDLLVVMGSSNAFSAAGDPYLPFRELLAVLTADVEARLRTGAVSPDHARRLWAALPESVQVLVDHGPDLIGSLLPGGPLLIRARSAAPVDAPWLADLKALVERSADGSSEDPDPKRLFSHVTAVLSNLSESAPLLLILDDLQWIDNASAALLFHLCRRLDGRRILLACAYRADEVAAGRDGGRHPLQKVLAEIKRSYGAAWIDLAELAEDEGRRFINDLLDDEPNNLDEAFRSALYGHTAGHPLFTVELLRAMQANGDLQQDGQGRWISGADLDWRAMPPRVEGVIEERIGRLDPQLQQILATASVEGELFTAQVVAHVEGLDQRRAWQLLSRELQDVQRLIREQDETRLGRSYLTRYRFSHALFQQYLYNRLGSGERRLLHGRVAEALQELLGDAWQPHAAALARHFQEADRPGEALPYWLFLGDQARISYAHEEAEHFYRAAAAELRSQGELDEAARTLMKLGLVYTADFQVEKAQEAYDEAFSLWEPARASTAKEPRATEMAAMRMALSRPGSLDPGLLEDEGSLMLAGQLFEGLVRIGPEQNILPAVARRWQVLDGGRRFLFHLDPRRRWNDGRPVTAGDFVFAWRRNLHPQTGAPTAPLLYALQNGRAYASGALADEEALGVKARDDTTLEVILESPAGYFPFILADPVTYPLPRWAIAENGSDWTAPGRLVCNGSYELQALDAHSLQLGRNPHYGGAVLGNVHQVQGLIMEEQDDAFQAYAGGEVDIVSLLDADSATIGRAAARFNEDLVTLPRWSTLYLLFRCDKPPFDDVRVRQAFAHAIDQEAFVARVAQSNRRPATGGVIPPGMPGHAPGIGLAFDVQRARDLLRQAGYGEESPLPAFTWAAGISGNEQEITFLRHAWRDHLGLDLQPTPYSWEAFFAKLDDDPAEITLLGWVADFPDPESMLGTLFHSTEGLNRQRWLQGDFDALIDQTRRTSDQQRRMALFAEADRILVAQETAVIPLSHGQGQLLVKPWVNLPTGSTLALSFRSAVISRNS